MSRYTNSRRIEILLPNLTETDILPPNMNAHLHHHAHPQSLEDRAICVRS